MAVQPENEQHAEQRDQRGREAEEPHARAASGGWRVREPHTRAQRSAREGLRVGWMVREPHAQAGAKLIWYFGVDLQPRALHAVAQLTAIGSVLGALSLLASHNSTFTLAPNGGRRVRTRSSTR